MKFIPITHSILTQSSYHWYYFANYLRFNTTTQYISISTENKTKVILTHIGENAVSNTYHRLQISRQAFAAAGGMQFPLTWKIIDEPTALMPHHVFDEVMEKINSLVTKSRNPMWRLFSYVYFSDAYFGGEFQMPQEQMAIELTMSLSWLNRALKQLIAWGLIERKGKYKFTGEETFAYRHTIPEHLRCGDIFHQDVSFPYEY